MKNALFTLLMAMVLAIPAWAYNSGGGAPDQGSFNREYRSIRKSATAGASAEILKGHILSYDVGNVVDGYTVTLQGANTVNGAALNVCVAEKTIATNETGLFRCITKGYIDFLRYDATNAISAGEMLCSNASGQAVQCAGCDNEGGDLDCTFGFATANSGIKSLEAEPDGSGANLKVEVNF